MIGIRLETIWNGLITDGGPRDLEANLDYT